MSDPGSIRRFEYRPCRIATGFNVDFLVEEKTFHGICADVSDTGIRVSIDGSLIVGNSGFLTLRHPIGMLELKAQVAYIEMCQVGFVFLFQTDWERAMTTDYIASIANHEAASVVVRFP